ncbi:hypothetical protein JCM12296A_58290 [Desulfosarcina cetonica]|uniref:hypothetical protein n=1 Tax=Desulfosarcina cetonica TaxID=90730 RepID=UPI0006D265C8|nr:hypothetical protein [Desulfosarcina cetonica]
MKLPDGFDLARLFPGDRLLRLHPLWFIDNFRQDGSHFSADITDYATEEQFQLSGVLTYPDSGPIRLDIDLRQSSGGRIRLLTKDGLLKAEIVSGDGEVGDDNPMLQWILAIREYIRIYLKTTPVTVFFRLLMNKMVLSMNPSQRKICMMITKITAVELLVIIIVVVGYVLFHQ